MSENSAPTTSSLPEFIAAMDDFTAWREHHGVQSIRFDDDGLEVTLTADDGREHTLRTGAYLDRP